MDSIKFTYLNDHTISESIRELVQESSYFKSKIFKSLIKVDDLNPDVPRGYKRFISDYIDKWSDYSDDLSSKIKSASGVNGVNTVKYEYVKDYIYTKDDYASVLPFADGVIKGIKSEKFKDPEDIDDFFKYTVNKAFHDKGDSVAEVLDSVLINGVVMDMLGVTNDYETKLFNNVKKYKMFSSTSVSELKKSILKVIDFMTDEMSDVIKELKFKNIRLFITMINSIVEYISYSITSYVCRIYIISQYAYPFINNTGLSKNVSPIDESTDKSNDSKLTPKDSDLHISINIMHNANELMCRDYNKCKSYLETMDVFVKSVGADVLFGINKPKQNFYSFRNSINNDNVFISKLIGNELYEFLIHDSNLYGGQNVHTEVNHLLKEYIYNDTQAYPDSYTPKQEMLYMIRNAHYDDTINGYKKLVKDMYLVAGVVLYRISGFILDIECIKNDRINLANFNTTTINDVNENLRILKELYIEMATAFLHKGRDIELRLNGLKNKEINTITNGLSIDIPKQNKSDSTININMMNSVPDTLRVPYDILDFYDLPTFECLEMYDDYLRTLPYMEDVEYLNEAVSLSSIINAIFSRIKAIKDRIIKFFKDKRFEANRKWVLEHANDLLSLDFNGTTINVLPYKVDINLPEGYNNLIKNLNNFDESAIQSEDSIKAFIKSLYPNETIYSWFYDNSADKSGPEKYRNYILFYDKLDDPNIGKVPDTKPISGATIHNFINGWITTMRESPDLLNQLERMTNELNTAVNGVKSKLVSYENKRKQEEIEQEKLKQEQNNPTNGNSSNNQGNQNNGSSNQNQQNQSGTTSTTNDQSTNNGNNTNGTNGNKQVTSTEKVLLEISITISRLYGSLGDIFINYFITMSQYLKQAYSVGHKK